MRHGALPQGQQIDIVGRADGFSAEHALAHPGVDVEARHMLHELVQHGLQVREAHALVHDQALASAKGDLDGFVRALCAVPPWFPGFPLEAEGTVADSYSKS